MKDYGADYAYLSCGMAYAYECATLRYAAEVA